MQSTVLIILFLKISNTSIMPTLTFIFFYIYLSYNNTDFRNNSIAFFERLTTIVANSAFF